MPQTYADLEWRGLVYQTTSPEISAKLDAGGVVAYAGFDPSADSLHVGHLLPLLALRRFQLGGNTPIVLAGGATGMIGDPSFKATERQLLDDGTIHHNVRSIALQLRKFLDFEPGTCQARLVNNHDWTAPVSVLDFLRDVGKHFTVNQLIARESVRARLEDREQGISFTEFSYSLLQAFDFWHLHRSFDCTLQIGASDQWGNIVSGVDLIRKREGAAAYGLCLPLMLKADGTKFGKSETGTVWLDAERTSPYALYQFFLRVEDAVVVPYLKYLTFLPHERIDELETLTNERPQAREAQRVLAYEIVSLVHGEVQASRAIRASEALFSEQIAELDEALLLQVFAEAPSVRFSRALLGELSLIDLLVESGLSTSKSTARTAIEQGGVSINNRRQNSVAVTINSNDLLHGAYVVVRRGKKEYALAHFEA
jgi:tyrosyl-tRNA synthetase